MLRFVDGVSAFCSIFGIAMFAVLCGMIVESDLATDTPPISKINTVAIEQRITDDRIAKVQADADEAMALCGYARSEAALSNAKSEWLRARLEILYRRQGSMPKRLSQWPGGDVAEMEEIR